MWVIKLWSDPEHGVFLESMDGIQPTGHGEPSFSARKEFTKPSTLSPSSELGPGTQSLN